MRGPKKPGMVQLVLSKVAEVVHSITKCLQYLLTVAYAILSFRQHFILLPKDLGFLFFIRGVVKKVHPIPVGANVFCYRHDTQIQSRLYRWSQKHFC